MDRQWAIRGFSPVQSCYVSPGSPAQQIEALRRWDPTKASRAQSFSALGPAWSPTGRIFEMQTPPDNSSVRSLVSATQKLSPELQIQ